MAEDNKLESSKILSITGKEKVDVNDYFLKEYRRVVSAKFTYYVWLSRFFIFLSVISLALFVSASLVIFKLSPEISIEPLLLVRQDSSAGIVRNEPISHDMASKSQLMEIFVKQYIILRNTIINDEKEMQTRWFPGGMVNFFSAPQVFEEFEKYRESIWNSIIQDKVSREVEIISIGKVGGAKSPIWKVDFKTNDIAEGQRESETRAILLNVTYWTSSVTAYFIKGREFMGIRLLNPLGFTVVRYSQTRVENL